MINTDGLQPIVYSADLAEQVNYQLRRIGAYDCGWDSHGGGWIAVDEFGYLAVADNQTTYVCEGVLERLEALNTDLIVKGEENSWTKWDKVADALIEADFTEIDTLIDNAYSELGETGYWKQVGKNFLVLYKEETVSECDRRVLTGVPGEYAKHYLESCYA